MNEQFLYAVLLSAVTGTVAGYLGSLMLSKRMALMGGALGHLALPGIALALLYDFDVSLGALMFLALGVALIGYLERKTRLHLEALTAVVFSTFLAAAFLLLPQKEADVALLGDVSAITLSMVAATAAVATALFLVVRRIYSPMVLMGISSDLAGAQGIDLRWHNMVYLACIALTVALGVRIMGGLMTAALLAIPACAARNVSQNLAQYAYVSMAVAGLSSTLGVIGSMMTGAPPGPLIILTSAVLFFGSVYFRTRTGLDAP